MTSGIDPVGIYAAIIATIAVAWRVFEWFNDRARLRLEVGYVTKLSSKPATQEDKPGSSYYLQLKVINIGRRPITLRDTGIHGGLQVFNATCHEEGILPKRLEPGESLSIDYEVKRLIGMPYLGTPKSLYIVDTTDRVYTKKVPARIRQWFEAKGEIEK